MKSAPIKYHRATSIEEAVQLLGEYEPGEARVLAGGQNLVAMLNMRLWRLTALIDVNAIPGLSVIEPRGGATVFGALTRHAMVEHSELVAQRLPLLSTMIRHVADRQVRNRGTLGGSLVHGDPSAEMPLGCLVLNARLLVQGPNGSREIAMEDFYDGPYAAAIESDEMLTHVEIPPAPRHHAFLEVVRRHGDFCVLSVAVVGDRKDDDTWENVRIGLGGLSETPVLAQALMDIAEGTALSDEVIARAAAAVGSVIDPASDFRASAEYRAHLAPIFVERALKALRTSTPVVH